MGKDFRVGLITGVVLAGTALIWVATRPSLGPQARVAADVPSPAGSERRSEEPPLPWQELTATEDPVRGIQATAQTAAPTPATPPGATVSEISDFKSQISEPVPAEPAPLPDLTIYERAEPIKTTRFHIVQKGDTLSGVSQLYYGSPNRWRKILSANQKAIKDPNKIARGTKLIIPD